MSLTFFIPMKFAFSSSERYACEGSGCLCLQAFLILALLMRYYEIFVYGSKTMRRVFWGVLFRWLAVVHTTADTKCRCLKTYSKNL